MKSTCLLFSFAFCLLFSKAQSQQVQPNTSKLIFEKVYLHTDREWYADGEDIWFKAYLVNGQTNQLLASSNNLYVELISPDTKIVERKVIRLDKGVGKGDFKLRDSIARGTYRLRAYTNWIRNFGDAFIFDKSIQVYSVSKNAAIAVKNSSKRPLPASSATVVSTNSPADRPPVIQFFPEGGSMIAGTSGILAFKAEGADGKGIATSGSIVSSTGESVAFFNAGPAGTGLTVLAPQSGARYVAKGTFANGQAFETPLPQVLLQGYSMNAKSTDSLVYLNIGTNEATFAAHQGKMLTILCKSKGKACYTASFALKGLQSSLDIPAGKFPGGIASITLYNAEGKPECERLVYIESKEKATLSVKTDMAGYQPKSKTTVIIKATDQAGHPVQANLSLAAVDAGMAAENYSNIAAYLNLQSEVKGDIESPAQYFDTKNANWYKQLDMLLLVQGWRNYTWKQLADSALHIKYALEQGITIAGKVTEKSKTDKPVAGANITLFAPKAKGSTIFSTVTDSAGRYYIDAVPLYGSQAIRLNSKNGKGESYGSIGMDSLYQPAPIVLARQFNLTDTSKLIALTDPKAIERRKASRLSDTIQLREVKIAAKQNITLRDGDVTSLGYKDEVYTIDPKDYDHKDLKHYLQHYSKAIVGEVSVGTEAGAPSYDLLYYPGPRNSKIFPRIIVDRLEGAYNVDTDDEDEKATNMVLLAAYQNTYLSMPVNKVEKVVIKHMLPTASSTAKNDVYIMYITFKPGALDVPVFSSLSANVTGYYEAREFYAPKYTAPSTRQDYRTTIHWAPMITTDANGQATVTFYNADPKTKVRIVAEGITAKGVPITGTAGYEVK